MDRSTMETARLSFLIRRKELLLRMERKDVVGKGNFGHKCQEARDEFSYNRAMLEISINEELISQEKKVTSKNLIKATQEAIKVKSAQKGLSA